MNRRDGWQNPQCTRVAEHCGFPDIAAVCGQLPAGLAEAWRPPLQLNPQTIELEIAQRWLADYTAVDVGAAVLVLHADSAFKSGRRSGYE